MQAFMDAKTRYAWKVRSEKGLSTVSSYMQFIGNEQLGEISGLQKVTFLEMGEVASGDMHLTHGTCLILGRSFYFEYWREFGQYASQIHFQAKDAWANEMLHKIRKVN